MNDHGEAEHGILLYRETLHVPLLFKLPRSAKGGTRDATPAGLRDLFPTLARLVGIPAPAEIEGRDLLAPGGTSGAAAVYSETYYPKIHLGWSELRSVVDARYHLIDGPRPELYDIVRDPAEKDDQVQERAALARSMQAALPAEGALAAPATASSEERERLKSLGYLTSGPAPVSEWTHLPNPRDQIGSHERMRAAMALVSEGKDMEALRALDEVLKSNPGLVDAHAERASTLGRLGRYRDAEQAYRKAIELAPALAPSLALTLGRVHLEMGQLREAETAAKIALLSEPGPAHELLATVALAGGKLDEAEREARLVQTDAGAQARAAVVLAEVMARRGRPAEALDSLDKAKERNAPLGLGPVPFLEFVRGDVLARMGRHAEAEAALKTEIEAFPAHAKAYASLAIVKALQGQPVGESRRVLEDMYRVRPGAEAAKLAARALEFIGDAEGAAVWRKGRGTR